MDCVCRPQFGFLLRSRFRRLANRAMTMVEIMIVMTLLAIVVGVAASSVHGSKIKSEMSAAAAEAKVFNDAIRRVELSSNPTNWSTLSNIIYVQKDGAAAIRWIVENKYVRH